MINSTLNFSNNINFFFSLFTIVNPIGVLPIFISMTSRFSKTERNKTNLITHISTTIILFIAILTGEFFLKIFGISINSLQIAGGLLIIVMSIPMLIGNSNKNNMQNKNKTINCNSIAVVPLALPLMAGPGAISACIIWSSNWNGYKNSIQLLIICILFSFFSWLLFRSATYLTNFFGKTSIEIITRIMGLLLISLGIEFVINSIKSIF